MITFVDLGMTETDFNFLMGLCGILFVSMVAFATSKLFI